MLGLKKLSLLDLLSLSDCKEKYSKVMHSGEILLIVFSKVGIIVKVLIVEIVGVKIILLALLILFLFFLLAGISRFLSSFVALVKSSCLQ